MMKSVSARIGHGRQQLLSPKGLAENPPGTKLLGTFKEVEVPLAASSRDRNDLDAACMGEFEDQVETRFVRKEDVGDDEIGLLRTIQPKRRPCARSAYDLVTSLGEDIAQHVEEVRIVIDQEDTGHLVPLRVHIGCHSGISRDRRLRRPSEPAITHACRDGFSD